MATPSEKSPTFENVIRKTFGIDRLKQISNDTCVICETPALAFKDELSKKEFSISGMCQKCQDEIFG
jgi:hypothetical protein